MVEVDKQRNEAQADAEEAVAYMHVVDTPVGEDKDTLRLEQVVVGIQGALDTVQMAEDKQRQKQHEGAAPIDGHKCAQLAQVAHEDPYSVYVSQHKFQSRATRADEVAACYRRVAAFLDLAVTLLKPHQLDLRPWLPATGKKRQHVPNLLNLFLVAK